jgi:hypothetical protein
MYIGATFLLKLQTKPKEQLLQEVIAIKNSEREATFGGSVFSIH